MGEAKRRHAGGAAGWGAAALLDEGRQRRTGSKPIPIIAVSSFAIKGDEDKARAAGCDHYVTKPYSLMQLLRLIRKFFGEKL